MWAWLMGRSGSSPIASNSPPGRQWGPGPVANLFQPPDGNLGIRDMTILGRLIAVTGGLAFVTGCSAGPGGGGNAAAAPPALQELSDLLHAAGSARPPTNLADLNRYKGKFLRGYEAVKSGDVVVLWGTPVQGEGDVGKDEKV